jgi:hypothetical protein
MTKGACLSAIRDRLIIVRSILIPVMTCNIYCVRTVTVPGCN